MRAPNSEFQARLAAGAPWIFVFLWSTGFVVARYATTDSDPLAFLGARLVLAALLLAGIAVVTRAPKLNLQAVRWSAIVGLGIHAVYLGGVFIAIDRGLPSGVGALIGGLHPVVTAVAGGIFLHEWLARQQWFGVVLGLLGVTLVVAERLRDASLVIPTSAVVSASVAMVGMSAGTIIQRKFCAGVPLLWGTVAQYASASVALWIAATSTRRASITFSATTLWALVWATLVLSLVAVLTMLWLLRHRAAASVSSLFFLVPALSAIEAAILFGEALGGAAIAGFAVALIGVAMVTRVREAPATVDGGAQHQSGSVPINE